MKTIILSDTHFGVKNNSITWLKSQLQGIDEIIDYIDKCEEPVEVVHCGDLFDSRSSINPYVVYKVNEAIRKLTWVADHMTILGGNHDYYSPEERDFNVTSLDFINEYDNLKMVTQTPYCKDGALFIPWFVFHNPDKLKEALHTDDVYDVIYTHTDLIHLPEDIRYIVNQISQPILTGHIHIPDLRNNKRITLGSCFSLNFADANDQRGFYEMDDNDTTTLKFHPLESTIKFYRIYNDDGINLWSRYKNIVRQQDQLEIYIDSNLFDDPTYKQYIKEYQQLCNVNVIINSDLTFNDDVEVKDFDIEKIIEQSIPDHLKERFSKLKDFIREEQTNI